MSGLDVISIGPAVAVQDLGRPGFTDKGLTRGGAADRLAMHEGAALLGQDVTCAALEMVGSGGTFKARGDTTVALTGAEARANIDGAPVPWNASHSLPNGATLSIGPVVSGTYAYLHCAGGFDVPQIMGARAAHQSVGLGRLVQTGDHLPSGAKEGRGNMVLPRDDRFKGGTLRIVPSMQTGMFAPEIRARFEATAFRRDPRANRQGMRLDFDGEGFGAEAGRSIVSEIILTGDIQVTGDGTPFILLAESQTTGGYPRIGTVIPSDIPRAAQTPAGQALHFTFVTLDEAREIEVRARKAWAELPKRVQPLVRDPHDMDDLLSFSLISGVTDGEGE